MLEEFLYPYISILKAEAWSIEQILDGLGLIQISIFLPAPGTAPSPTPFEGMRAIFNCLLVYSIFLSIFLLVVGYVLRRKRGLLSVAILLMLPGLLGYLVYGLVAVGFQNAISSMARGSLALRLGRFHCFFWACCRGGP